jgi:hypothetical protein
MLGLYVYLYIKICMRRLLLLSGLKGIDKCIYIHSCMCLYKYFRINTRKYVSDHRYCQQYIHTDTNTWCIYILTNACHRFIDHNLTYKGINIKIYLYVNIYMHFS